VLYLAECFWKKYHFKAFKNDSQRCFYFFFAKQKNTSRVFFFQAGKIFLLLNKRIKITAQVQNLRHFVEKFQNFASMIQIITFLNSLQTYENIYLRRTTPLQTNARGKTEFFQMPII